MYFLNLICTSIFDIFFYPFNSMDPVYGLAAVSLLTAVIVIPIFKYASNQEAIRVAKGRIYAHLLEVWIYRDDTRTVLVAQKDILLANLTYLRYMIKPIIFIMPPLILILIQIGIRYEYRPFSPGETAIVRLTLTDDVSGTEGSIAVGSGLKVETPVLRSSDGKNAYWRVRATGGGDFGLSFMADGHKIEKPVLVEEGITALSPVRERGSALFALLHPGEPALPGNSIIKSVEIGYPARDVSFFGWRTHWLVIYFILSIFFGYALARPFGVKI